MFMRSMTKSLLLITCALCAVALGLAFGQAGAQAGKGKLMNPASLNEKAPAVYRAKFDASKGTFVIEVTRAWAPNGADRFYNLVKNGYYDDCKFFRVVAGFMVQFGINGDPKTNAAWSEARIPDDPVKQSNTRGFVTFAMAGPNTRTTQIFINYSDQNSRLDASNFAPFGKVIDGMKVVDSLYSGYGDFPSFGGKGPDNTMMVTQGNAYLDKVFSKLDSIKSAVIEESPAPAKK
jgi:peptidyl-prolyl cis-trans isomerase A (cyclophilin A)